MTIGRIVGGRYELQERVATGAIFQVFRARDRITGRPMIVKLLVPELQVEEALCTALRNNCRTAQSLSHPNIAGIYDLVDEDGVPVIVTEYVRGMDLKERIKRVAPMTVSLAVEFAVGVCEALQYAHSEKMVHGDLRPQNILISPDGEVKVTDFGIAPALNASPEALGRNLSRSAPYTAPETSSQSIVLPASDLYALGCVLYEMVTGVVPYQGDNPVHVAHLHQTAPVPSPRDQNAGVPRALDGIIRKALQKEPEIRYHAAQDMLADLKKLRDALRFGRPVTWSPLDEMSITVSNPTPQAPVTPRSTPSPSVAAPLSAEAQKGVPMPQKRREPNGLPPFLRGALLVMLTAVALLAFLGLGLWLATISTPEEAVFPDLVGKSIETARAEAAKLKIQLIEREEFNDNYEKDTVFRVDYEPGRRIRPGRSVRIWVSKGSRMVWVPDLTRMSAQEAEAKLEEVGLKLGQVARQNHDRVPYGHIISQNPRSGKRVERDTEVNLVISDGPADAPEEHTWNIKHKVPADGRGPRQVRIEYEDDLGTATAFDEVRDEGDVIEFDVTGQGRSIRVRVYYGDDPEPVVDRVIPWRRSE